MNDGFCIYVDTVVDGPVPVERNERGNPFIYATREEAEREIALSVQTRIEEYLSGEREFDDAMTVEEFIVAVDVLSDGSIVDAGFAPPLRSSVHASRQSTPKWLRCSCFANVQTK